MKRILCLAAFAAAMLYAAAAFAASAPTLSSISPSAGPATLAAPVTITGTNFTTAPSVTFGSNSAAAITAVSATRITCTAPTHAAGAVTVTVTVAGGATATGSYTFNAAPAIANLDPATALNTCRPLVTITGTGFGAGATVTWGAVAAGTLTVASATTITCYAPTGSAGTATVTVTNADLQTASAAWKWQAVSGSTAGEYNQVRTFQAGQGLGAGCMVKTSSGKMVLAGTNDTPVGIALKTVPADALLAVRLLRPSVTCLANGSISAGGTVYLAGHGLVGGTGSVSVGTALNDTTVAGQKVEVLLNP